MFQWNKCHLYGQRRRESSNKMLLQEKLYLNGFREIQSPAHREL